MSTFESHLIQIMQFQWKMLSLNLPCDAQNLLPVEHGVIIEILKAAMVITDNYNFFFFFLKSVL